MALAGRPYADHPTRVNTLARGRAIPEGEQSGRASDPRGRVIREGERSARASNPRGRAIREGEQSARASNPRGRAIREGEQSGRARLPPSRAIVAAHAGLPPASGGHPLFLSKDRADLAHASVPDYGRGSRPEDRGNPVGFRPARGATADPWGRIPRGKATDQRARTPGLR